MGMRRLAKGVGREATGSCQRVRVCGRQTADKWSERGRRRKTAGKRRWLKGCRQKFADERPSGEKVMAATSWAEDAIIVASSDDGEASSPAKNRGEESREPTRGQQTRGRPPVLRRGEKGGGGLG